jgi:hypothetical protein
VPLPGEEVHPPQAAGHERYVVSCDDDDDDDEGGRDGGGSADGVDRCGDYVVVGVMMIMVVSPLLLLLTMMMTEPYSCVACAGEMTVAFLDSKDERNRNEICYGDADILMRLISRKGLRTEPVSERRGVMIMIRKMTVTARTTTL